MPVYETSSTPTLPKNEINEGILLPTSKGTGTTTPFDLEFDSHLQAIKARDMEKAIQTFVSLKSNNMDNTVFQDYLIEVAHNIHPSRDTELCGFFSALPCLLQSDIINSVKETLAPSNELKVFEILFDYIVAYPRHAYKYMTDAIRILIHSTEIGNLEERVKYAHLLVTDLFPRLCKQRLALTGSERKPLVKCIDSKHYIILPYPLFQTYLSTGQQYYIGKRQWNELSKFTCMMISSCGYHGFDQLSSVSHTIRFQYLKEHRLEVRMDSDLATLDRISDNNEDYIQQQKVLATSMCEYMMAAAQFVCFGYEYSRVICGEDSLSSTTEKTCLIPICAFQPSLKNYSDSRHQLSATVSSPVCAIDNSTGLINDRKRQRETHTDNPDDVYRQKKVKRDETESKNDRGEGLLADCMKGVDEALKILSRAADCLRHLVDLWHWATSNLTRHHWVDQLTHWEIELDKVIDSYNLPFDIKNASLLLHSDLALSSPSVPGNLAKALELSQTICDRIEVERRKGKKADQEESGSPELNIPFMFAFRVLYNIAVIYLLVGSIQQSTLEIAIILSVFPIPNELNDKDFINDEIDCRTVSTIFQDREFGLMRVDQVGLVTRCIKHLVVSLDSESEQKGGMASIDSAMRWDEKAGNMIVLMQYGWPYWSSRTGMWDKILSRIKEKRTFKNREFLEYIYVADILKLIRSLHDSGSAVFDIIPPEFALRASYRHLVTSQPLNDKASHSQEEEEEEEEEEENSNNDNNTDASTSSHSLGKDHVDKPRQEEREVQKDTTRSAPPPIYQPSFANQVLPSMSMSPSWYAASTQKSDYTSWMSPSFYYSRPATSVVLPKKQQELTDQLYLSEQGNSSQQLERQQKPYSQEESTQGDHELKGTSVHPSNKDIVAQTSSSTPSFSPRDIVTRCLDHRLRRYSPKVTPQRMRHVLQSFLKNMVLKGNDES